MTSTYGTPMKQKTLVDHSKEYLTWNLGVPLIKFIYLMCTIRPLNVRLMF